MRFGKKEEVFDYIINKKYMNEESKAKTDDQKQVTEVMEE